MSYREVRDFTEMLRALGYTNMVSMEHFRQPNFPLVADLLYWLTKRIDPDTEFHSDIENEDGRVNLIRNCAQFMAIKANIKLNTKRLYQSDGYAVKELLKITILLYNALKVHEDKIRDDNDDNETLSVRDFDVSDKINDLKQSRQLASEITVTGASLFELLGKEVEVKSARHMSINRQYEVAEVEDGIKKAIEALKQEINETKQLIDNVSVTEATLDSKIERRKVEIDRYERRLQTLKKVKPAFLEEFTELERELEELFIQYSVRIRCLSQLESMVTEAEKVYLERQQAAALQKMSETVPMEKADPAEFLSFDDDMPESGREFHVKQERPRARTGGRLQESSQNAKSTNELLNTSSIDLSTESDSEEILLDGDDQDLNPSDDESLGFEIGLEKRAQSSKFLQQQLNSDEDF